mmetsp:Transcript_17596/g.71161  ORF Transcript_17596/g.71161 Transcript_17596/m.71161 type:complete len:215 (+) Transcript_17596:2925-3569(+)
MSIFTNLLSPSLSSLFSRAGSSANAGPRFISLEDGTGVWHHCLSQVRFSICGMHWMEKPRAAVRKRLVIFRFTVVRFGPQRSSGVLCGLGKLLKSLEIVGRDREIQCVCPVLPDASSGASPFGFFADVQHVPSRQIFRPPGEHRQLLLIELLRIERKHCSSSALVWEIEPDNYIKTRQQRRIQIRFTVCCSDEYRRLLSVHTIDVPQKDRQHFP